MEAQKSAPDLVGIRVELFGQARLASSRRLVEIATRRRPQTGQLVAALAEACPELVGIAIRQDKSSLLESYTFNLNGVEFLSGQQLNLKQGDELLLFSSQAGG